MARLLDGKAMAAGIRSEVAVGIKELRERGATPRLDVILVGDNPASETYVRNKQNDCAEVGIESEVHRFGRDASQKELAARISDLNDAPEISAFFMQLPLPEPLDPLPLISAIDPDKDADGLSPASAGNLAVGLPSLLPCTPHGIIEMLKRGGVEISGREAVILGRSNLVGKPLAQLLLRENATVTVCHSRTQNLPEIASRADILVAAIGRREMVGKEYVKRGAAVVDVGIHRREIEAGGGLTGDVSFDEVEPVASYISPVPGGVGPMTRAMLLYNTLEAARSRAEG